MVYAFGAYELDTQTSELRKSGVRVKFAGQPLQVLTMLVERNGEIVTRQELKDALWKEGTFTDFDHGVDTAIERIRRTLGDSARTPMFIETLARRGYRFVAPARAVASSLPLSNRVDTPALAPPRKTRQLPRVAVLPFKTRAGDHKTASFAEELTQEITTGFRSSAT
jgi:cholera toxin transcriptional activator